MGMAFHLWNEGIKTLVFVLYQDAYTSVSLSIPQLGSLLQIELTLYAKPETYGLSRQHQEPKEVLLCTHKQTMSVSETFSLHSHICVK